MEIALPLSNDDLYWLRIFVQGELSMAIRIHLDAVERGSDKTSLTASMLDYVDAYKVLDFDLQVLEKRMVTSGSVVDRLVVDRERAELLCLCVHNVMTKAQLHHNNPDAQDFADRMMLGGDRLRMIFEAQGIHPTEDAEQQIPPKRMLLN